MNFYLKLNIPRAGFAFLPLFLWLAVRPFANAADLTDFQKLGREVFKEMIETDTTHSHGDTTRAAELLAQRFVKAGFPTNDVLVIGPGATNRNLVVRFRGTGARPPVVLIAHLDVVEAKPEDWSLNPFVLTEKDGYFYGRGTSDDKDGATTLACALLRLKGEGFKPDRDLILALTAGEEGGEDVYNGAEWLLQNRKDLVWGAFCLNADAGGLQKRKGKRLLYAVQAAEKVYQSYRFEVKGPGGHSSKPGTNNPIYTLSEALLKISHYQFPLKLSPITRAYFERMADIEGGEVGNAMHGVAQNPPAPEAVRFLSNMPYYNAILRTTAVATLIEGGHAENALPQVARATVNCRMLPGDNAEDLQKTLTKIVTDSQVSITPIQPSKPSPPSLLTPEVEAAIEKAKEDLWPGLPMVPEMETGATDGLYFRQLGIPTYGITGTAVDVEDVRAHGKDERMGVQDFYDGLEFEYRLIKAIATP